MAITTLDGLISGATPPQNFYKVGTATVIGRFQSLFFSNGYPGSATTITSGVGGAALTGYTGQIPFTNPAGGLYSYLSKFSAVSNAAGTLFLCDRLWHNSGLVTNTTSTQTVNSVAFPTRDINQSINGEGCFLGLEITTVMAASTIPVITVGYTSSSNVQASGTTTLVSASPVGNFWPIALVSGHTGVKEVRTFTSSVSIATGAYSLVCYRILASVDIGAGFGNQVDSITSGFPRLSDNTVPFLLWLPAATTAPTITGQMIITQG
jgi:hypothetical protein